MDPAPRSKVDLQGLIEDWAMDYFKRKASKKERKLLEQDQIQMEIDWKRVKFVHDETKYEPEPPTPGHGHPTQNILCNTTFANKTKNEQKYTFKTEKTTRSSCTVYVEQGYTKGIEMNIKLTTPCQILEANAGFHREMALNNGEEETIEEEMTWGVESEIQVGAEHVGEAKLVILEEKYEGEFTMKTHISGRVRVVFTNMKDNNSFIKVAESQVVDVVQHAISSNWIKNTEAMYVDKTTNTVQSTTRGKCRFHYGIKQMIEIDQKPMNNH